MSIIEVHNLRKAYGETRAVADVSFSVEENEIFGILGPNGAGKTTTVECLQGLRTRDGGTVRILDMDPEREPDELRRVIGSQLQAAALPERLRVREALNLFAAFADEAADVDGLLKDWGLWEKRGTAFDALSGGQRQRLFVALALVNRPRLVFLDELTTGLDPAARRTAWELVRRVRDAGATVVLVTHFMDEAQTLCDRLAIIDGGRVVACDAPAALLAAHTTGRVVFTVPSRERGRDFGFLASVPGVEAVEREGSRVTVGGGGALLQRVAAALLDAGIELPDLAGERPGLEDVFLRLTGHAMRED
jgi:ABC-2 type transport system ATP-binding protein